MTHACQYTTQFFRRLSFESSTAETLGRSERMPSVPQWQG